MHLEANGAYHVIVNQQPWLTSSPTFFRINGMLCSPANGCLQQLGKPAAISGKDTLGQWRGETLLYSADEAKVSVSIRAYETGNGELAIFTQVSASIVNSTYLLDLNSIDCILANGRKEFNSLLFFYVVRGLADIRICFYANHNSDFVRHFKTITM